MTKPYKQNLEISKVWRYLPLIPASGKLQMAIDRWLLHQCQHQQHPPTLRFYTWHPAAISLGYHQKRYPEQWQQFAAQETLDLVRRPTGGRAVLHQGDLTYAVVWSGISGKRLAVYEAICEFLISGWKNLGIPLFYGHQGRGYREVANCFQMATGADLVTAQGEKLIGSAQLRRGETVLQHGSMQLHPDPELFQAVFNQTPRVIPFQVTQEEIIAHLKLAAQRSFQMQLVTQPLTSQEWDQIRAFI
ncbi:biotin/lipoate A/B protein ligase [Halothece sp. PCC 7418]|uniref:lipoate--protein ligase family protein n=1 Tax=Halothece sp. (strain PCC 7418) TaxID=65093 RepID=UPI0002A08A86|nr:biotin/lipoate A/B protein ligase family protein [Halothece sp. PCC 7418]AFZ45734.1 biotin/lipoate A/B protein ligase [Halothece sp. PCC 7418]